MELEHSFSSHLMNSVFSERRKRIFPVRSDNLVESETQEKNNILDDEEDDKEFEVLEETNIEGNVVKKVQNKNTHKIRIIEERVSDALRDLQIEMDTGSKPQTKINPFFKLSDELKTSMQNIKHDESIFTERLKSQFLEAHGGLDAKKMQIVPWIPNKIVLNICGSDDDATKSEENEVESDCCKKQTDKMPNYQVEEPYDKKNLLKRKYSLMNTICIEEVKPNEKAPGKVNSNYIVELGPDEDLPDVKDAFSNYCNEKKSGVYISEVEEENESAAIQTLPAEEEQMEL